MSTHTIQALYQQALKTPSDISEHLPTLYRLAQECDHVTEMGTRWCCSTRAFLAAQPQVLVCYDLVRQPEVDLIEAAAQEAGRPRFQFISANVLQTQIEPTDLLFVDTFHVYEQTKRELALHADKVRKYLILHDTTTYGEQGEAPGSRGIWPAIEEFLETNPYWKISTRVSHNNGLTILSREAAPERFQTTISQRTDGLEFSKRFGSRTSEPDEAHFKSRSQKTASCEVQGVISAFILARNEAQRIEPALQSLQGWTDQIIVIDSESEDDTVAVARRYTDCVLTAPRATPFGALRNLAIPLATGQWLFSLDADERVPPRLGPVLQQFVRERGHEFEALCLPFKHFFCGRWMQHGGWWPGYKGPQLLKIGHFRFGEGLHSSVSVDGRTVYFPADDPELAVLHHAYDDPRRYLEKLNALIRSACSRRSSGRFQRFGIGLDSPE